MPTEDITTTAPPEARLRDLWRNPDFVKLWIGQAASEFATQVTTLALPLVAVLALDATAGQVGTLNFLAQLPYVLFALYAGVVVDRLRRRDVLLAVDLGRAVVLAAVPVLAAFGGLALGPLYAVAFLIGGLTVFFQVAYQAYLPTLVDRRELSGGNSLLETSRSAAQIGGPALGGGLVQLLTAPFALVGSAAAYLVSAWTFWLIKAREDKPERGERGVKATVRGIGEGLRVVFGNPALRANALMASLFNFGFYAFQTTFLLFLPRELGLSAGQIGIVLAGLGPGLLVGSLFAHGLPRRIGYGRALAITAFLANGSMLPVFLLHGDGWSTVLALAGLNFLFGMFGTANNVAMLTIRQAVTPDTLLGRVAASVRFFAQGASPLGALLGGFLATALPLRTAVGLSSTLLMLGFVVLALSPLTRIGRELPTL
ncbi:MFS transporter [Saccharothrix violaceirubra]|uniref:Na+/melibiose symporter-like transporter n=1 Tax=Saccharothrix violaceirubra TaxID=413306 RepID=A0A7W7WW77_9PSEU|nr:MFS transporter [Saccharothrix violaceirubra]MBB4966080.1 Na+/melibiose symporter-like transporter [Saccharothrix violaceirubra]